MNSCYDAMTYMHTLYKIWFLHNPRFYEALLGFLNPIDNVWCLDLQFHLEAFEFTMIHCSLWIRKFYNVVLYKPCIFPSLIPFLKTKITTEASHKNVFWMKINACRNETIDGNDTTILSHHPYSTSCGTLPTMHTTKLFTCTLPYSLFTPTK